MLHLHERFLNQPGSPIRRSSPTRPIGAILSGFPVPTHGGMRQRFEI